MGRFDYVELVETVDCLFMLFGQSFEVGNQIPALLSGKNFIEARHTSTGHTFRNTIEPELIRILFVEIAGQVWRLFLQGNGVGTVAATLETVASCTVLGVDTTTGVGSGITIGVNGFTGDQSTPLREWWADIRRAG